MSVISLGIIMNTRHTVALFMSQGIYYLLETMKQSTETTPPNDYSSNVNETIESSTDSPMTQKFGTPSLVESCVLHSIKTSISKFMHLCVCYLSCCYKHRINGSTD